MTALKEFTRGQAVLPCLLVVLLLIHYITITPAQREGRRGVQLAPFADTRPERFRDIQWYHHGFFLTSKPFVEKKRNTPSGVVVPEASFFGQWGASTAALQWSRALTGLYPPKAVREKGGKLIFIDLGARNYESSTLRFRTMYPHGREFTAFAIDPDNTYAPEFERHNVTFLNYAAFTQNGTAYLTGRSGGDGLEQSHFQKKKSKINTTMLDIGDWLARNTAPKDLVVCKMDVEGAEFALFDDWQARGLSTLVDELFLECHGDYEAKCRKLMVDMLHAGIWVHEWPY